MPTSSCATALGDLAHLLADQIELVGQHLLRGKLRANVSAAFSSAGGFTGGQLGAGSSSNSAIVGACPGGKPSKP